MEVYVEQFPEVELLGGWGQGWKGGLVVIPLLGVNEDGLENTDDARELWL
jgi:hypothetical protein